MGTDYYRCYCCLLRCVTSSEIRRHSKVISEMVSPKLHPLSMEKVYMPMTNTLLDTGDITEASIVKIKIAKDVTNEDVEEAMESIATAEGIVLLACCHFQKWLNYKRVKSKDSLKSTNTVHRAQR